MWSLIESLQDMKRSFHIEKNTNLAASSGVPEVYFLELPDMGSNQRAKRQPLLAPISKGFNFQAGNLKHDGNTIPGAKFVRRRFCTKQDGGHFPGAGPAVDSYVRGLG